MPLALLRFVIPLILAVILAIVIYRYATKYLEYRDNKDARRHKRKLERDRRDHDMIMEYAEHDEIERELRKERQKDAESEPSKFEQ